MEKPPKLDEEIEPSVEIYIDLKKVTKGVDIIPDALKNLPQEPERLDIKPGICLVVGYNGSGKTTFLTGLHYSVTGRIPHGDQAVMEHLPALYFSRGVELGGNFEHVVKFDASINKKGSGHMGRQESLSNRQAKDYELDKVFQELRCLNDGKSALILIDEPEAGMDPWRHQKLAEELEQILKLAPKGSTLIIATNSPVLASESKYPRIDLRNPQAGVQATV